MIHKYLKNNFRFFCFDFKSIITLGKLPSIRVLFVYSEEVFIVRTTLARRNVSKNKIVGAENNWNLFSFLFIGYNALMT